LTGELNNLFVRGFPLDTSEDELLEEFKQYGLVKNISVIPGKGYAIISFDSPLHAEDAIIGLRDRLFKGQLLQIDVYENKSSTRSRIDSSVGSAIPVSDSSNSLS
jgi:RNA recognition motif-containing protein